jgi:hypothetical protein
VGALRIILLLVMIFTVLNIVRKLITGTIKAAAWKEGTITDVDGAKLCLRQVRSFWFSFVPLVIAMIGFLVSA